MAPDKFDVTIIIPTHNRAGLLTEAVDSCLSQAKDGFKIQVIVIDDASTDNTREVLERYGKYIETVFLPKNVGASAARNAGLKKADGRYIKFLDSDDVLERGSLYKEVCLGDKENADIVVSGFGILKIGADKTTVVSSEMRPPPDMYPLPDTLLWGRQAFTSSALYRKEYVKGLEWDPDTSPRDDWDWFCRACLCKGKIVSLDCVSYWWRNFEHPRISINVTIKSFLSYTRATHKILNKMEGILAARGELTEVRKRYLAMRYYWGLRGLAIHDRERFEEIVRHINLLDPHFIPIGEERQKYMLVLYCILGIRRAILFQSFIAKIVKGRWLNGLAAK